MGACESCAVDDGEAPCVSTATSVLMRDRAEHTATEIAKLLRDRPDLSSLADRLARDRRRHWRAEARRRVHEKHENGGSVNSDSSDSSDVRV